jgi:deazaflavin-dependent oxidoreductase (nitroreductase family)
MVGSGGPSALSARLEHVGRRSGRRYATPVVPKPVTGGYAVPLPYGRHVDWLRNLEAAGRARLQVDGQRYRVANPRIVPLAEIETQLPAFHRRTSARRMIPEWLVLTAGPDAAAPSTTSASSVLGVTGGQASGCTESPRRRSDAVAPSKRIG